WWDWSAVKVAAEWLLDIGEVACVRRIGWRRVYDLPERVIPADLLNLELTDEQCLSRLLSVAARALGVVTPADGPDYHRLGRFRTVRFPDNASAALDEAAQAAGLTQVTIDGGKTKLVSAWADPAALSAEAAAGGERHRVTLLSPFDSLVWDRKRTLRMFGFE